MFGVGHIDGGPFVYGIVIFLGLWSMVYKFQRRKWAALGIEVAVFILVFKLHGGSMAGGFAATVAALLAGVILPPFLGRKLVP